MPSQSPSDVCGGLSALLAHLAGNWSLREFVDRLEPGGVHVQVQHIENRAMEER